MVGLLLAVHCKRSDPVNFKDAVLDYITNTYGQRAAEDSRDDLVEVEAVRARVINQPKASAGLRGDLIKYYRLLNSMESRFPISNAPDHVNVTFEWFDSFHPNKSMQQANIYFEKAAIAFNIAASISQYALDNDRSTEKGATTAIRLFQEAAGAFVHLRDNVALKVDVPRPIDLSPECAAMLERLMLAQAQECVLEKATKGGKQPATLARLAKQVALFYDETSKLLSSKPLSEHFDKSWQAHAAVKSLLFHLEADLQNAAHLRDEDYFKGVASEIAQLKAAKASLEAAKKEAKYASKELQENVADKEKQVAAMLMKAEKANAMVYLQRVPAAAELPAIVPACLVKSIIPEDVGGPSDKGAGGGMFRGVVPETITRALSKYTDMVDALTRKQTDTLDGASDEARIKLREWELPESLAALEPQGVNVAALPDALRLDLEKVEETGGLPHLQDLSNQLKNLKSVTRSELQSAETDLANEAKEDEELRNHYGARWNRQPSSQLTAQMIHKINGYKGNLAAAGEADAKLEARLIAEGPGFAGLDPLTVAATLPRLQAPMLSVENMEPAAVVNALRSGLEGLAILSSQRAALEQALKERKAGDDILPKLLAGDNVDNVDSLFKLELTKYDDLVKGVEENIQKQRQLLDVIGTANSSFREMYNFEEWRRQCDIVSQDVRATVRSFNEIASNLSEGVRFYTSLQEAIVALRRQIGDYVMTRKVQRDDLLNQIRAETTQHMAFMSLRHPNSSSATSIDHAYTPPPPPPPPLLTQNQQQQTSTGYHAGGQHMWNGAPQQQQQGYFAYGASNHVTPPPPQQQPQLQPQYQQPQQYQPGYGYNYTQNPPSGPQPPPPPPPPQLQQQSNNPLGNFFGLRHE